MERVDPRQAQFGVALGAIEENMKEEGIEITAVASTDNFYFASNVDLGWLQDEIARMMESGQIEDKNGIDTLIRNCIQRTKRIVVRELVGNDEPDDLRLPGYHVSIVTKDDMGYYDYGFYTRRVVKKLKGV